MIHLLSLLCSKCRSCDPILANEAQRGAFWGTCFPCFKNKSMWRESPSPAAPPLLPPAQHFRLWLLRGECITWSYSGHLVIMTEHAWRYKATCCRGGKGRREKSGCLTTLPRCWVNQPQHCPPLGFLLSKYFYISFLQKQSLRSAFGCK